MCSKIIKILVLSLVSLVKKQNLIIVISIEDFFEYKRVNR